MTPWWLVEVDLDAKSSYLRHEATIQYLHLKFAEPSRILHVHPLFEVASAGRFMENALLV